MTPDPDDGLIARGFAPLTSLGGVPAPLPIDPMPAVACDDPRAAGKGLSTAAILAAAGDVGLGNIDQVLASRAPAKGPSSSELSRYCPCGKRGPGGRLLKARDCCLKTAA